MAAGKLYRSTGKSTRIMGYSPATIADGVIGAYILLYGAGRASARSSPGGQQAGPPEPKYETWFGDSKTGDVGWLNRPNPAYGKNIFG